MNWKTMASIVAGFAVGYTASSIINGGTLSDPEKVLASIKKKFRELGHVSGTWILMTPEKFRNQILEFDVYQGGITVEIDAEERRFEFIADAKTGAILTVNEKVS
ncbi:MAG: peptidase [Bacillales bacterium]|jgi:predicted small secreted protein|nr:peptidase [Bacillales bacterium]